jgi:hypothetical protein
MNSARPTRKVLVAALAACLVAAVAIAPALGAGKRGPKTQKVSLLYAVDSASGTLQGKGKALTLKLQGTAADAVWFSDRPERRSGSFPSGDLASSWKGFGFAADPPNAALVYEDPALGFERTVILRLSKPRATKAHSLTFAARVIGPAKASGNLGSHGEAADNRPAAKFGDASLFVDDGEAPVAQGCVLQPHANCSGHELDNFYIEGVELQGITLNDSNMAGMHALGINFEGATILESNLEASNLSYANFEKANLGGSDMSTTTLVGASFKGANLTNANFIGAEEANLAGAKRCNTKLPNGSIDNSGC